MEDMESNPDLWAPDLCEFQANGSMWRVSCQPELPSENLSQKPGEDRQGGAEVWSGTDRGLKSGV